MCELHCIEIKACCWIDLKHQNSALHKHTEPAHAVIYAFSPQNILDLKNSGSCESEAKAVRVVKTLPIPNPPTAFTLRAVRPDLQYDR